MSSQPLLEFPKRKVVAASPQPMPLTKSNKPNTLSSGSSPPTASILPSYAAPEPPAKYPKHNKSSVPSPTLSKNKTSVKKKPSIARNKLKSSGNCVTVSAGKANIYTWSCEGLAVRPGKRFCLTIPVRSKRARLTWRFSTKKHSIGFAVVKTTTVAWDACASHYGSHDREIRGQMNITRSAGAAGTRKVTLIWDNTCSWFQKRELSYHVELVGVKTRRTRRATTPAHRASRNTDNALGAAQPACPTHTTPASRRNKKRKI